MSRDRPSRAKAAALLLAALALLAGCGNSSPPNAEELREQRDGIRAELLLNSVEIIRAQSEEDDGGTPKDAAHRGFLKHARDIEQACREGDYLESCDDLAAIEEVVASME